MPPVHRGTEGGGEREQEKKLFAGHVHGALTQLDGAIPSLLLHSDEGRELRSVSWCDSIYAMGRAYSFKWGAQLQAFNRVLAAFDGGQL
jgi:hypothetical protein